MKLQDPLKQHPPFDVAAGLATALIAQGFLEVKQIVPAKPYAELKWHVSPGPIEGDYQFPPRLFHSCGGCGVRGMTESSQGTAHKSTKVYHCGERGLMCPPDVAAQYEKAFAAWKARSKKPPVEKLSPVSPAYFLRAAGIKSKDQLILEAKLAAQGAINGQ
jgi:hypothetical protein